MARRRQPEEAHEGAADVNERIEHSSPNDISRTQGGGVEPRGISHLWMDSGSGSRQEGGGEEGRQNRRVTTNNNSRSNNNTSFRRAEERTPTASSPRPPSRHRPESQPRSMHPDSPPSRLPGSPFGHSDPVTHQHQESGTSSHGGKRPQQQDGFEPFAAGTSRGWGNALHGRRGGETLQRWGAGVYGGGGHGYNRGGEGGWQQQEERPPALPRPHESGGPGNMPQQRGPGEERWSFRGSGGQVHDPRQQRQPAYQQQQQQQQQQQNTGIPPKAPPQQRDRIGGVAGALLLEVEEQATTPVNREAEKAYSRGGRPVKIWTMLRGDGGPLPFTETDLHMLVPKWRLEGSAAAQMYAMGGVDVRCFSGRGCEGAGGGQQEVVLDMDRRVDILFDVVGRLGKFAVQDDVAKHRFSVWEGETRASTKRIRAFYSAHPLLARSDRFKGAFATAFNRDLEEWALGVAERAFESAPRSGRIPSAKKGDLPPIPPIALDMTWTLFTLAPLMAFLGNSDDDDDVPRGMGGGGASDGGSSNTDNGAGGKGPGHRRLAAARGGEGCGGGITRRTMIAPATEKKGAECHAFKESGVCTHAARTRIECKYQHPGGESHEGVVVHAKAGQKRKRG